MFMTPFVDFVTWLQVLFVTVGIATSITIPINQQNSQANLQTNSNENFLPENSISSSSQPESSTLFVTFSLTSLLTSTVTESSIKLDSTRETEATQNQTSSHKTKSNEIEYATTQQNQLSMSSTSMINNVLLRDSDHSSTQHLNTNAFYGIVERLRNVIFPTTSSSTVGNFIYLETVQDQNRSVDEERQSEIFVTSPPFHDDFQNTTLLKEESASTPASSGDYLEEDDIHQEIMKVFKEQTAKIKLKPSFMVSLVWDMMQHYKSSSSFSEQSSENDDFEYDVNPASETTFLEEDHLVEVGDVYHENAGEESDIEEDSNDVENSDDEDETNGYEEPESEDVHENFQGLIFNIINLFSEHSHKFDDDGHRKFLDFILLLFHRYMGYEENNMFDNDHSIFASDNGFLRHHNLNKNNYTKIDDIQTIEEFEELIENLKQENTKQMDSQIADLGINEDMHGIIAQVIEAIRSDQHGITDCAHQCLATMDQKIQLYRRRSVSPSQSFMSQWNLTRDNWQQRLEEIKTNFKETNDNKTPLNESRQCFNPSLETESVHNHRYLALSDPDSNFSTSSSIVIGDLEGVIEPDHVYVYRCRNRYGCCSHMNDPDTIQRVCAAKKRNFFLRVLAENIVTVEHELLVTNSVPRLFRFYNDIECYCKVLSKHNKKCSSYYEFVDDDVSNTECRCLKGSVHYSSCRNVMNGIKKVSPSDLRCIRMGKCITPKCSNGSFDTKKASCPRARLHSTQAPPEE